MSGAPLPSSSLTLGIDGDEGAAKSAPRTHAGRGHGIVKHEEMPAVIERYLGGALVEDMAKERGITKKALYKAMHKFMLASSGDEGYSDLITQALAERVAETDDELQGAASMLEVNKWSQLGKFARMDFERKRPSLYGAKPILTIATVDINGALQEKMEAVLNRQSERLVGEGKALVK